MAKRIASITGTGLRAGVSKNRRWYKPEHLAAAAKAATERLAAGDKPMVMLTFHGADDNSREIAASLTRLAVTEDGRALDFAAGISDTPAGWDIANLADTTDGQPAHLKNVSIRGYWTGKVRKEKAPDGQMAETADGLVIDGIDFTKSPGVTGAEIKTFAWASSGRTETDERVLITESVEGTVTVTEETPASAVTGPPEGVREALAAFLGESGHHVLDNGECVTCAAPTEAKDPKKPYGDVTYADPGYQSDGKKRYPLDTSAHVRSAWSYVNQAKNAGQYTAAQLKRIKGRIKAAMSRIGAKVSAETAGWVVSEPRQITEAIAEWYGDPSSRGSWSISASNGPVNLSLSSWSMDPADLDVILRAAADAACTALAKLDPDMDGDVDVPGVGDNSDTDGDAGHETAPETTEDDPAAPAGETGPAPAGTTQEEDPAMAEDTTAPSTEAGGAAPAGLTLEAVREAAAAAATDAVKAALAAAPPAAPAAAAQEGTPAAPAASAQEDADARTARVVAEALKAAGFVPGTAQTAPAAAAQETAPAAADDTARIDAIVAERLKEAGIEPKTPLTEADKLEARILERVQALVADGTVVAKRNGIVVEHGVPTGQEGDTMDAKALADMDADTLTDKAGAALDRHIFGGRGLAVHTH